MASRSHRTLFRQALCAGLILGLALALPALADDEKAEEPEAAAQKAPSTRTVTVGKATMTWNLAPETAARPTELVATFKKAAAAHLSGDELHVTPKAGPVTLPSGHRLFRLPVELMHTMFAGPAGRPYCSDSTVAAKASATPGGGGEAR